MSSDAHLVDDALFAASGPNGVSGTTSGYFDATLKREQRAAKSPYFLRFFVFETESKLLHGTRDLIVQRNKPQQRQDRWASRRVEKLDIHV
jgi:hypothetical protein